MIITFIFNTDVRRVIMIKAGDEGDTDNAITIIEVTIRPSEIMITVVVIMLIMMMLLMSLKLKVIIARVETMIIIAIVVVMIIIGVMIHL